MTRSQGLGIFVHGCPGCGNRYEAHGVPSRGPRGGVRAAAGPSHGCAPCTTGRPAPFWEREHYPRDCCRTLCRPIRPSDADRYLWIDRLSPDYPWFLCPVPLGCGRAHPFVNPAEERVRT